MAQSVAAERSPLTFPNNRGKKRPPRLPSSLPKPYHHFLEPSTTQRHTARECSAARTMLARSATRHQPQRLIAQSVATESTPLTFAIKRGEKRPLRPPSPLPKPYHHCLGPSTTRRHAARECSDTIAPAAPPSAACLKAINHTATTR